MYDSIAQIPGLITDEFYHLQKKNSTRTCIVHRYPWTSPLFRNFFNSSLLCDVFIINSIEQLQTLPKNSIRDRYKPISKNTKALLYSIKYK